MSLSYEEGMDALKSMFPSWDPQVLSELLQGNGGRLEETIEMALTMEDDKPTVAPHTPVSQTINATRLSATMAPQEPYEKQSGFGARSKHRVSLPVDFLCLPDDSTWHGRVLSEQEQQDAMLAEMMQNEIFREELLEEREFQEYFGHRPYVPRPGMSQRHADAQEKSTAELANETLSAMGEKFSEMSETMKRKMHEVYLRFQTRSDAPKNADPYSHRPLINEDSDNDTDDEDSPSVRHRQVPRSTRDAVSQRHERAISTESPHNRKKNE